MFKFIILVLFITVSLFASEALETNSIETVQSKILEKGKKYGIKNVLAVFDIDNTVMVMNQNLGSDQWFGWQSKILNSKDCKMCAAKSFNELLDVQGILFALSSMSPTEGDKTVKVIKGLQAQGYKVILLTSRGYVFRDSTERELNKFGLDFRDSAIGPQNGFAGTYFPYSPKDFKKFGLTQEDIKKAKINNEGRPVSYMNGVFMTSGLNKGIMLKTLLHKVNKKYKAIVFSDDHEKHTKRMQEIMGELVDLTTFRYGAYDAKVKAFHASDKVKEHKEWTELSKTIGAIFK